MPPRYSPFPTITRTASSSYTCPSYVIFTGNVSAFLQFGLCLSSNQFYQALLSPLHQYCLILQIRVQCPRSLRNVVHLLCNVNWFYVFFVISFAASAMFCGTPSVREKSLQVPPGMIASVGLVSRGAKPFCAFKYSAVTTKDDN